MWRGAAFPLNLLLLHKTSQTIAKYGFKYIFVGSIYVYAVYSMHASDINKQNGVWKRFCKIKN